MKDNYSKSYFNQQTVKKKYIYEMYKKFMRSHNISLRNLSICDLGCALGAFLENVKENNTCYGIDISQYAIQKCKKKFPDIKNNFYCVDLNNEKIIIHKKFDLITMFDVIEHLKNFSYLDAFVSKNLKKGGYLLVTTPNANSFMRFLSKVHFTGELDKTHTLLFTPYTLDFFLRHIGLKKIEISTPFIFYFKDNFLTRRLLFGSQIFAIYKKIS